MAKLQSFTVKLRNTSAGVRVVHDVNHRSITINPGQTSREFLIDEVSLSRLTTGRGSGLVPISGAPPAYSQPDIATEAEQGDPGPLPPSQRPQPLPTTDITAAEVLSLHEARPLSTQDLQNYVTQITGTQQSGTPTRGRLLQTLADRAALDAAQAGVGQGEHQPVTAAQPAAPAAVERAQTAAPKPAVPARATLKRK